MRRRVQKVIESEGRGVGPVAIDADNKLRYSRGFIWCVRASGIFHSGEGERISATQHSSPS